VSLLFLKKYKPGNKNQSQIPDSEAPLVIISEVPNCGTFIVIVWYLSKDYGGKLLLHVFLVSHSWIIKNRTLCSFSLISTTGALTAKALRFNCR
jgi:hypothetical protein